MSEWLDNQKQSISSIRQLLQERIEKAKQPELVIELKDDLVIDDDDDLDLIDRGDNL